jgi:hypothetical protein
MWPWLPLQSYPAPPCLLHPQQAVLKISISIFLQISISDSIYTKPNLRQCYEKVYMIIAWQQINFCPQTDIHVKNNPARVTDKYATVHIYHISVSAALRTNCFRVDACLGEQGHY